MSYSTISPIVENVEHTLKTLRYASRIKEGIKSNDISNSSIIKSQLVGEGFRRPPLDITSKNTRKKDVVGEIKKILLCIEDTLPSLHTAEELERMLNLCKDLKSKMNLRTDGY